MNLNFQTLQGPFSINVEPAKGEWFLRILSKISIHQQPHLSLQAIKADYEAAGLEDFGENADGSYDWDVYLLGDGITINSSTPVGQGATIYLDLNTNSADGLVAGTYTYANERAPFTWVFADACASFNTSNFSCASGSYNASAGTVVISGSGNNTTIEVNLTDTSGASITASYTGGFSIID
mgnify:CR=1 FL=1